jgi:hypothetical protein
MKYDTKEHHRRSIRLRDYDYAEAGAYFVTVCTQDRQCLFGNVEEGMMRLNALGEIVQETWGGLPDHYPHVELDAFIVMPSHVHMIILLTATVGAGFKPAPTTFRQTTRVAGNPPGIQNVFIPPGQPTPRDRGYIPVAA